MNNNNNSKAGIYIHIPFCTVKCLYCDFYSITDQENNIPTFVNSLLSEIKLWRKKNNTKLIFNTIFFGGGTPSLLETKWIDKILKTLHKYLDISNVKEITLETNPGDITLNKLKELKAIGINRLSMGFQSFNPKLLLFLDRIHSDKDCISTFDNARRAGFENINADLMYNIPGQSLLTWTKDLNLLINLVPDHISAYSLTVEKGTPLNTMVLDGIIKMPSEKIDVKMYKIALNLLNKNGYQQYEISNYSLPDKECKHNLHYWNLNQYIAFGPSGHGYNKHKRWWNVRSLNKYIEQLQNNILPISGEEKLSKKDHFNEYILNGLRLSKGIDIKLLESKFPKNNFNNYLKTKLNKSKFLKLDSKFLKIKSDGILFSDGIASDLFLT